MNNNKPTNEEIEKEVKLLVDYFIKRKICPHVAITIITDVITTILASCDMEIDELLDYIKKIYEIKRRAFLDEK